MQTEPRMPQTKASADPSHTHDGGLDSDQDTLVEECFACPGCGERRMDWLVWSQDGDVVDCQTCGATYDPNEV